MTEMTFNVQFHAVGIPKVFINPFGSILLEAHNMMANLTNGKYEAWNKEFDEIHSDVDLTKDEYDPIYIDFIGKKIAKASFDELHRSFPIMTFSIGEEGQLVGHVKMFPDSSIEFFMVPVVQDKEP